MSDLGLSDLQRWFQAVVTHPDGISVGAESEEAIAIAPLSRNELESMVTRSEKLSAQERLSIYAQAYFARLIECLGESFPVLKQTLGEELFNGFAFGYLQQYPSRSYTLARLADKFAQFLHETRPSNDEATADGEDLHPSWPDFLIDLANLEWNIADVFDGPGIEKITTLNAEQLLDVTPEQWGAIRLQTAPCLRLMKTQFPVNGYFTAIRLADNDTKVDPPSPEDSYVALSRREYIVRRHELSRPQYELLVALQDGRTIAEAIEHAALAGGMSDDDLIKNLPSWFGAWTRHQFFVSFEVT